MKLLNRNRKEYNREDTYGTTTLNEENEQMDAPMSTESSPLIAPPKRKGKMQLFTVHSYPEGEVDKTISRGSKTGLQEEKNLRAKEMIKQQCHFAFAKHRLASIHFASLYFWTFTLPAALISMANGILAFLATAGLFSTRVNEWLNVIVGSLSFFIVFLQTISAQLDFDNRAKMHRNTATDLRDLREDLENSVNRSRAMIIFGGGDVESSQPPESNGNHDHANEDVNPTGANDEIGKEDVPSEDKKGEHKGSLENILDVIQKRYIQCLKGNKSTLPVAITDAFNVLDSRLNATMSRTGHKQLYELYGSEYNNIVYFHACDDLVLRFTSYRLWPLFLPDAKTVVDKTMEELGTNISKYGNDYWNVLITPSMA